MSSIFEKIDQGLSGNALTEQLTGQVITLTSIGSGLSDLIQNPPDQIRELIDTLGNIKLPNTNLLGDLPAKITELQSIIPANLSEVTGSLSSGISDLLNSIGIDIIDRLQPYVAAYNSANSLLQLLSPKRKETNIITARQLTSSGPGFLALNSGTLNPSGILTVTDDEIDKIMAILNRFPEPFNVENILQYTRDFIKTLRQKISCQPGTVLPVLDEIYQSLETILEWKTVDGTQIAKHLESTLLATASFLSQSMDSAIQPIVHRINILNGNIDTDTLHATLEGLSQGLLSLGRAVTDQNITDINSTLTNLTSLSTQLETIIQNLQTNFFAGQTESLLQWLVKLDVNLSRQMQLVFSTLDPEANLTVLNSVSDNINKALTSEEVNSFFANLNKFIDWLYDLLDQLDLSVIEGPISMAATTAQSAVAALDNVLIEIVTRVSRLFDDVDDIINLVDTEAIANAITGAISDFQQFLQDQIDVLFAPIRAAIAATIGTLDGMVDNFDPAIIIEALRSAIQTLTGILTDPEVLKTLDNIKEILDRIIDKLNSLSFTPVNDLVIEQIDEVKTTLQGIDTSSLNATLKAALRAALEVLPDDDVINSLKESLVAEMDNLLESGPIPLLNQIKKHPERLLQKVQGFAPVNLVGAQLSKPFQQLLGQLQAFTPGNLLIPVQNALDEVKAKLVTNANPGQFIVPLEEPFDKLVQAFNNIKPEDLITPLQERLDQVVNTVLEALPLAEFFTIVDTILAKIQSFVDHCESIKNLSNKVLSVVNGLENPAGQIDTWINGILTKLAEIPSSVNLQPVFDQINDAINSIKEQPLKNRVLGPLQPFIARLESVQPQNLFNDIIRYYRDFPYDAIDALPETEKQHVRNFLADVNPLNTEINRPISALHDFLVHLQTLQQTVNDFFSAWDNRYHGSNSPIHNFIPADLSIQAVKNILADTINHHVKEPMTAIFQIAPLIIHFARKITDVLNQFSTNLHTKLANLVNGPASLTKIRDSMNAIVIKVRGFNLNFLVDELKDLFENAQSKLAAISPEKLRGIIESAFSDILQNIDISRLIPRVEIAALDARFAELVAKISALDPQKLVTDVLQPEFDEMIQPYLETFDLTTYIQALIDRMERLHEELTTELDRTGKAFSAMLDAVPI